MGAGMQTAQSYLQVSAVGAGPELGFMDGLGRFLSEEKGSAPSILMQADYGRTVNIAIVGNSGTGKSLLVNTVRAAKPSDPSWAPVGVTETTKEPKWYEFPGDSRVHLWDMEGAGTSTPWENYAGNIGLRYFDVVLLLCSSRVTDSDIEVMRELENQSLPFFFVRTKLDEDIKNNAIDTGMNAQETEDKIRCDLQLAGITSPYLINARRVDLFDFPRLIKDIMIRLEIFDRKVTDGSSGSNRTKAVEAGAAEVSEDIEEANAPGSPKLEDHVSKAAKVEFPAAEPPIAEAPPAADTEEAEHSMRFRYNPGLEVEPIEALYADGGHWIWYDDDGLYEYFSEETGSKVGYYLVKMAGVPEHTWSRRPDGIWQCKMKNFWTSVWMPLSGKDSVVSLVNPNNKESSLEMQTANTKMFMGTLTEFIAGGRLISEQKGQANQLDGKAERAPCVYRVSRFVSGDLYWLILENVMEGRRGIRRFKRFPFYRIVNETGQMVVMKTYSTVALFSSPNATATVEPGTHCVDCYRGDVLMEQVVFSLPNRTRYAVSQAEPFETYCLRTENFA